MAQNVSSATSQWAVPRGLKHLAHLLAVPVSPGEVTLARLTNLLVGRIAPLIREQYPNQSDLQGLLDQVTTKLEEEPLEADDPKEEGGPDPYLMAARAVLGLEQVEQALGQLLQTYHDQSPVELVAVRPPPTLTAGEWVEGITDLACTVCPQGAIY